jgi:uncharacterized protein
MNTPKEPRFLYDVLIDKKDICDRTREIKQLLKAAKKSDRTILLAPRRYGKTSLVKNIVGNAALRFRPKRLVIAVDFMSVTSLGSIATRLNHGIGQGLAGCFSSASLMEQASRLLNRFSVGLELNPITGVPSVQLKVDSTSDQESLLLLGGAITAMEKRQPLVLIFDEFQDVGLIPEAEGLFRSMLQSLGNSSVFLLGSKRHLMDKMFGNANAPLFGYGDEMTLGPIPFQAWEPYFSERLATRGAAISSKGLSYLITRMCDVPNAICELGAWLQENYAGKRINEREVEIALDEMVDKKQGYAYRLAGLTSTQRQILQGMATRF